jgi:Xaa-Pro aminopeptidase
MEKTIQELVEIFPVEYQPKPKQKGRNPRVQIYWNYTFDKNLTQGTLKSIVEKKPKLQKSVQIQNGPDHFIYWQYGREPQIILNKLNGKACVSKETLDYFGEKACQIQASYLLRVLESNGHAHFVRRSATFDPVRTGKNREERELYRKAMIYLFNDDKKKRE